ncbi:hypothetical protein [Chitinophaga sp.]|uniref:hypothetical protein n=1 Tax=Chitinophaga sp. TaxID=1869181 RepID=UPI0031DDE607
MTYERPLNEREEAYFKSKLRHRNWCRIAIWPLLGLLIGILTQAWQGILLFLALGTWLTFFINFHYREAWRFLQKNRITVLPIRATRYLKVKEDDLYLFQLTDDTIIAVNIFEKVDPTDDFEIITGYGMHEQIIYRKFIHIGDPIPLVAEIRHPLHNPPFELTEYPTYSIAHGKIEDLLA